MPMREPVARRTLIGGALATGALLAAPSRALPATPVVPGLPGALPGSVLLPVNNPLQLAA